MKKSLLELVDVVLQRLQEPRDTLPSETGIRSWLVREGYAKRDIDAALKVVGPRFAATPHVVENGPGRIRHLMVHESYKLTGRARAALARLELFELISPHEREVILERLDHFEGEIGISELDYLVSWVLGGSRDVEYQQTVYNVLEGERHTLH